MIPRGGHLAGVGCDTECCGRFRQLLEHNERFLERWFTDHERNTFLDPSQGPREQARQAARLFTLKEAAIKALWNRQHLLPDAIEVRSLAAGSPDTFRAVMHLPRHADLPFRLEAGCIPLPDGWESAVLAFDTSPADTTDHTPSASA